MDLTCSGSVCRRARYSPPHSARSTSVALTMLASPATSPTVNFITASLRTVKLVNAPFETASLTAHPPPLTTAPSATTPDNPPSTSGATAEQRHRPRPPTPEPEASPTAALITNDTDQHGRALPAIDEVHSAMQLQLRLIDDSLLVAAREAHEPPEDLCQLLGATTAEGRRGEGMRGEGVGGHGRHLGGMWRLVSSVERGAAARAEVRPTPSVASSTRVRCAALWVCTTQAPRLPAQSLQQWPQPPPPPSHHTHHIATSRHDSTAQHDVITSTTPTDALRVDSHTDRRPDEQRDVSDPSLTDRSAASSIRVAG